MRKSQLMNNEEESMMMLSSQQEEEDTTETSDLTKILDGTESGLLWSLVRHKIHNYYSPWDFLLDKATTIYAAEDEQVNSLQVILDEVEIILKEVSHLLDSCCVRARKNNTVIGSSVVRVRPVLAKGIQRPAGI